MKRDLPKKGDKEDMRCAFAGIDCPKSENVNDEHWCEGCKFYVCQTCDVAEPMGTHDVMEHKKDEDEDAGFGR